MASPIGSVIRSATKRDDQPFNILSWIVHERYQSNLAKTNANYFLLSNGPGTKGAWRQDYSQVPRNTVILPNYQNNPLEVIPSWINFDIIMTHHKFGIIQTGLELGHRLNLPVVHIEHTQPTSPQLEAAVPQLKQLRGKMNVFISPTSRTQWGFTPDEAIVIEHGVDSKFFKPLLKEPKNQILTVGNDMINRAYILGFDTFDRVVIKNNLPFKIVGDTPGLSEPAKNVFDLKTLYGDSTIYFNPSRLSPLPMSLLEAMSMGLACVSTDNNLISEVIENGVNGYKTNSEEEQRAHLKRLLSDKDEREELGKNARQTILTRFNLDRFVQNWNDVFSEMVK